jgi:ribonuclease HI
MAQSKKKCRLYTDGLSKGNPGKGAIGILICDEKDKVLKEYGETIGHCTNNEAEYKALIKGLELAAKYDEVSHFSDSELMVNQVNKGFKVKAANLRGLVEEVWELEGGFSKVTHTWVSRESKMITLADGVANEALENKKPKKTGVHTIECMCGESVIFRRVDRVDGKILSICKCGRIWTMDESERSPAK